MQPHREPRLLIDGYNVLFQSHLVGTDRHPGWLQQARYRLVNLLDAKLDDQECARTQVVFDAAQIRAATEPSFIAACGVCVTFAIDHDEADDLLEVIIRKHSHPKQLRVISSDNRIRRCAATRKAIALNSEDFLDELERLPSIGKPERSSIFAENIGTETKSPALERPERHQPETDAFDELPTQWLDDLLLGDLPDQDESH